VKTYSRIFHHLTTEDVKRKQREGIAVQRSKENDEVYLQEQEIYVASIMENTKSNWRKDLDDK